MMDTLSTIMALIVIAVAVILVVYGHHDICVAPGSIPERTIEMIGLHVCGG